MKKLSILFMVIFIFGLSTIGNVSAETDVAKLLAFVDGAANDYFGRSVAVDGDTAVIGAYGDDGTGSESGAVYVFVRSEDSGGIITWTQQDKLTVTNGANDQFGRSVAVDGNTAVIGAPGYGSNSGAVYVFVRSEDSGGNITWTQQDKLTAGDDDAAAGDHFGYSVAVDGDTAVIGAYGDDDNGSNSGSAYVFVRSSGTWTQQDKLTAYAYDAAAGDYFGKSVAVDGDTAVIGAYGDDDNGSLSGSAYVFVRSSGTWTQQTKLPVDDGLDGGDIFGISVAVDGDTAVIGAYGDDDNGSASGSAYVFVRSEDSGGNITWEQQDKLTAGDDDAAAGDYFGRSVAVDGGTAVIGAYGDDDKGSLSGSAYVFNLAPSDIDNDNDGVPNDQDNCPDIHNTDQADSDYDSLGDVCDDTFDTVTVVDALVSTCQSSVTILEQTSSLGVKGKIGKKLKLTSPAGVKGMISKLAGKGSFAAKVVKAEYDYANGNIDACTYLDKLDGALSQLEGYDEQLEDKIDIDKTVDPDEASLQRDSTTMWIMINDLISDAVLSCSE
jgi:hypothetical protein